MVRRMEVANRGRHDEVNRILSGTMEFLVGDIEVTCCNPIMAKQQCLLCVHGCGSLRVWVFVGVHVEY